MARKSDPARDQARPGKSARRKPEARRRQLRFTFGARRQEIAGVLLIMLAAVSLLAVSGITTGSLIDGWSSLLKWSFGWGAFAAAILIGLIGFIVIRRAQGARIEVGWLRLIGLESVFFAVLAALHAGAWWVEPWPLLQQGGGGGVI